MRILLAVHDEKAKKLLCQIFQRRAVIDVTEEAKIEDVDYYLSNTPTPYQLLIYENFLRDNLAGLTVPHLEITHDTKDDSMCRLQRIHSSDPTDIILKKAYGAVSTAQLHSPGLFTAGQITIDPLSRHVTFDNSPIKVTSTGVKILESLCLYGERGATANEIADHLYPADRDIKDPYETVLVHLSHLKKAIKTQTGQTDLIETKRAFRPRYAIAGSKRNTRWHIKAPIQIGLIQFCPETRALITQGDTKLLNRAETRLLEVLSSKSGIHKRSAICQLLGNNETSIMTTTSTLRKKMKELTGGNHYIIGHQGIGLQLSNQPA